MKVYIIRDGIFTKNNGKISSNLLHYEAYGTRFLSVFSETIIVGRLFNQDDPTALPVEGAGVKFIPLPGYHGPIGFLKALPKIIGLIYKSTNHGSAYILRVPSSIPSLFAFILWLKKIPFAIEVAADPYDSYSAKALDNHPFSLIFQKLFVKLVKWQCRNAASTAYVTNNALQIKYPPKTDCPTFSFTSIDLHDEAFVAAPRKSSDFNLESPHIVLIGNMQGSMKGHDTLLEATKIIHEKNIPVVVSIIGYGSNEKKFRELAVELNIHDHIKFLGKMPSGKMIRDVLDTADLFVLPSRQEGLPRALLEAMARGLPCIATAVGGTPELLGSVALVPPNAPEDLANAIVNALKSPTFLTEQSERNLNVARDYHVNRVRNRRHEFFNSIKTISDTDGK